MKINHHFDDATLLAYSSGTLSAGMALVVDAHIERCASCRAKAFAADRIGGDMLDRLAPEQMSPGSFELLMTRLETPQAAEPAEAKRSSAVPPKLATSNGVPPNGMPSNEVPEALVPYIGKDLDSLPWRALGVGVYQYDLKFSGPGAARLLRIKPGVSVPHHTHKGGELTLILRGSYSDEVGRFRAGDVADLDEQIEHQPMVDTGQECICLIATDAPLKFTGLMGKLIQPFIGL